MLLELSGCVRKKKMKMGLLLETSIVLLSKVILRLKMGFAPIAHLGSLRLLLGLTYSFGFKLYQIDVKSAFLNGVIKEEMHMK